MASLSQILFPRRLSPLVLDRDFTVLNTGLASFHVMVLGRKEYGRAIGQPAGVWFGSWMMHANGDNYVDTTGMYDGI